MRPDVAILCGGRGTRLREGGQALPKPLVEIGGHPILWHVIQLYATQGFARFWLLTGYRHEDIAQFARETAWPAGVEVTCVDTGEATETGGRLHRVRDRLSGTFCATYADGLADVDLGAVLEAHRASGAAGTVTVVRPELPFGVAVLGEDDRVTGFQEKPRAEHWINGGFFCFEPELFEVLGEDSVLERGPLEALARGGRLRGHRHEGFWACMDTYKDQVRLNDLWTQGAAPWKRWK